jgi:hypothetical protein
MRDEDKQVIIDFINSPQRNAWLNFGEMEVYVRKAVRYFSGIEGTIWCFDVANINIIETEQGKGKFTKFFDDLIKIVDEHDFEAIFIESVINEKFAESLRNKKGFIEISHHRLERHFLFKL